MKAAKAVNGNANDLCVYFTDRRNQHGYWHDTLFVYDRASVQTIDQQIAHCDEPGYYATECVAARVREKFVAMKADGVTHVFDFWQNAWIRVDFQQYQDAPRTHCRGHVTMPTQPSQIEAAFKLFRRFQARMSRVQRSHDWHRFDVAEQTASRMCDARVEPYRYGDFGLEYVLRTSDKT